MFIISRYVYEEPETFIAKIKDTVKRSTHKGEKDGIISYWFQPKDYEKYEKIGKLLELGFSEAFSLQTYKITSQWLL